MAKVRNKLMQMKNNGEKAFIPYVTFAYPSIEKFEEIIIALDEAGVSAIEIGLPFSDPIADGPVIQQASIKALENGANLEMLCESLKRLKEKVSVPLLVMTYYNLLFGTGLEKFFSMIEGLVDGLVIPDILVDDSKEMRDLARKHKVDMTFFVAPTTQEKRVDLVNKASTGFIYYVSVTGTTGTQQSFDAGVYSEIKKIANKTTAPVCVGFGISNPEHVKAFNEVADGVIVGSAIIKKIMEYENDAVLIEQLKEFVRWLMRG